MAAAAAKLSVDTGTTDSTKMTDIVNDRVPSVMLPELVQNLVGGTSERFVPRPSDESRTVDAIDGIGAFKQRCRWAEFWRNRNKEREVTEQNVWARVYAGKPELLSSSDWERAMNDPTWQWPDPTTGKNYDQQLEEDLKIIESAGLKTGLKPTNPKSQAPEGSRELEAFLKMLEEEILRQSIDDADNNNKKESAKSSKVNKTLTKLKTSTLVVVPTDKTNSFRTMETEKYKIEVLKHLESGAKEVPRAKLTEVQEQCFEKLDEIQGIISEDEYRFLQQKIKSKAIPQPKILIKDHKKKNQEGDFPTRLVVPATNFTAGFPKLGYMGIKKIFEENDVNYGQKNLVQASDLKEKLESIKLDANDTTIVSIDAEMMYPSIKYGLIKKAIKYYSSELNDHEAELVDTCLDLIRFGMSTTLITFVDKYYMYDGDLDVEERGLTIGGYESAWLADLVMSFLLETIDQSILDELKLFRIYRDDGLGVFKGKQGIEEIANWLERFQDSVNEQAGNSCLSFTAEIWRPEGVESGEVEKMGKVTMSSDRKFPFLDMEMWWNESNKLEFGVYLKPNQELKYLNAGSSHTPGCFKAIPTGVYHRLTKLTSMKEGNKDSRLDELYPKHFESLRKANLVKDGIPTLGEKAKEIEENRDKDEDVKLKKRREDDRKRAIYFKAGFTDYWRKPLHKTIKEIKAKFPTLSWLRVSMSYHRFLNLRELFQGDLNSKVTKGLTSKDFETLPCNCRNKKGCPFLGRCRESIVVYQACCLITGKKYIGNTQQHVKKRIQQHVQDTKQLFINDKKSDSFANHFAKLVPEGTEKKEVRNFVKVKVEILWKGNPLSCVKTFGTKGCKLCNKERMAILNLTRKTPKMAINKCNEVYGACRHRPRFHRFDQSQNNATSTDESDKDERVPRPSSTTSVESSYSTNSLGSFSDQRESSLLPTNLADCDYMTNRVEGLRARHLLGLERDPNSVDEVSMDPEVKPQEDIPLVENQVEEI